MAVRTGAGTGVVVSLVVFVLTTVFLLVLAIVFYAGKTKEIENRAAVEATLDIYAGKQRNTDQLKTLESAAKAQNRSVALYLNQKYEDAMTLLAGDPNATIESVKMQVKNYGVADDESLRGAIARMSRDVNVRQGEIDSRNEQIAQLNAQIAEKEAQLAQAQEAHNQEVAEVMTQIDLYKNAAETYRQDIETAIDQLNQAKDSLRSQYEGDINTLQEEVDNLGRERAQLIARIKQFEQMRAQSIQRSEDPAYQVDGHVIDAPGSNDEIFIDRGQRDRIVLGMTFEVYGDKSQIRLNPQTGEVPRGKASLQVTRVDPTTSVAKITRSTPGQPIVRNDVIANAIYDPHMVYKFLVHGKFDIDGDGRPTEGEAEYIRSLIIDWGATVVSGDELPGDLDFLVLGAQPPKPPPPRQDATQVEIEIWVRQNEAHELYSRLFNQARESSIPVLNANRFFILIGHTQR